MAGTVDLDDVFRMLAECAPQHDRRLSSHYWKIALDGKVFPALPTGAKSDKRKEIQIPKVAKMVRVLGVDRKCACRCIPALGRFLRDLPVETARSATQLPPDDEPR